MILRNSNGEITKSNIPVYKLMGYQASQMKSREYLDDRRRAHKAADEVGLKLDKPWKDYDRQSEQEPAIERVQQAFPR
jgi:hypothetical protein